MKKLITDYFSGAVLQEISPLQIQRFLVYLNQKYQTQQGKPLAPKTILQCTECHFRIRRQTRDACGKPHAAGRCAKERQKPVDALTVEQAAQFFHTLMDEPLDFQCMMQLLLTSGIRRGKCLGLKWKDVDEKNAAITIPRSVVYTPESGIIISTPKTANSIRTIPIMASTLHLLQALKRQTAVKNKNTILENAFILPSRDNLFHLHDPNAVTRRVKRFMKRNELPDLSPHDLRHTFATMALQNGVDVKTVSSMLGHYSAGFTLDTYAHVTTDAQLKAAQTMGSILSRAV